MAEFIVAQSELTNKKDELKSLNDKFSKKVEELVTAQQNLNKMWDGDANDAFNKAFNEDKGKMESFYKGIQDYVSKLELIIKEYENAEKVNYETATNRK